MLQFLSCTHIGGGGSTDAFRNQDADLIALLDQWSERGERVILLGDIVDLWQSSWRRIYRAHKPLIKKLLSVAEFWVIGDRDWALLFRPPAQYGPRFVSSVILPPVYAEHSHFQDLYVSRLPRLARATSRAVGLVESLVHPDSGLWANTTRRWVSGVGRFGSNKKYAAAIAMQLSLQGDRSIDTIVFGHTHDHGAGQTNGLDYLNPGSWVRGRKEWVSVEDCQ